MPDSAPAEPTTQPNPSGPSWLVALLANPAFRRFGALFLSLLVNVLNKKCDLGLSESQLLGLDGLSGLYLGQSALTDVVRTRAAAAKP